ncbi:hypothetical protein KPH14_006078 [Odynerus spinipes]|uniref:HAUS augmin-like complex subunit 3 N-terminal domain-containing protein n=1 Tax=Odynerus spinipes TaxID=1348599 RepID=A0AAD9RKW2_9HYME|nr:hypothetical protein KPH14_006078 [Odynerus spinipes]
MSISGKILHKKIQSLRPDLSTGITPEILDQICDIPTTQPFLKWFCDNVTRANVLSKDELDLKNKLQHTEEWLSGRELDEALEEATKDNPELLKLIDLENEDIDEAFFELDALKDLCKMDENYIHSLKSSTSHFKELEFTLEDDIEWETNCFEKEQIEMIKAFTSCSLALEEFDVQNRLFSKNVEHLLKVYTDAAENKGTPILWTQMPIDQFLKQIRLYNDNIDILVKRQFGSDNKMEQHDLDYKSLINDSKESQINKQTQELALIKSRLTDAKLEEIDAKLRETSCKAMAEYAHSIYNNGNLKIPEQMHLRDEILDLTRKRNFLEENVMLSRERQLEEVIEKYVESATTEVLQQDARAKLKRRQIRLDKLKSVLALTREHGHAHSDLLCMLINTQYHLLNEIFEFVADARHYLTTEYSLSSMRCESMRQQQEEYEMIQKTVLNRNTFDKLFVSMVSGNDVSSDALNHALIKYDQLIANNKEKKRGIFESYLDKKIDGVLSSEKELSSRYEDEMRSGVTSFAPLSYELNARYENTFAQLDGIKANLTTIRSAMKEQMRNNIDLKRETEILWQRFLADPDTLRNYYEEAKRMVDQSHFGEDI